MDTLKRDILYSLRVLTKNSSFSAVVVLTLALAIGANTAIFSIVNAVLVRPLSYSEPEQLVQAYWRFAQSEDAAVTGTQYEFWAENSRSFSEVAAYAGFNSGFNLSSGRDPVRVSGMQVSADYLDVLRIQPAQGRSFLPEEDRPGGPGVAVISHDLWRTQFSEDPLIVGQKVTLNGVQAVIVGVLPRHASLPDPVDLLVPLRLRPDPRDDGNNTGFIARLKPGISMSRAQGEMDALLARFSENYPRQVRTGDRGVRLVPYKEYLIGDIGPTLWLLFGAVGFVLLIACVNVSNLMVARSVERRGEMAIRSALGAGIWRIARQLITESMILGVFGGLAGYLLALWTLPGLIALSPEQLPRLSEVTLDLDAALFTMAVSVFASIGVGVSPALRAARLDLSSPLKSLGRQRKSGPDFRMRGVLIAGQVALSLMLLTGAGLLIRSLVNLYGVELGFNPENVITMQVSLNTDQYRSTGNVTALQEETLDLIRGLPGVASAASVSSLPTERGLRIGIGGIEGSDVVIRRSVQSRWVSPDFFRTMQIPLLRGRDFAVTDGQNGSTVTIVNEAFVNRYLGGKDPLGSHLTFREEAWRIIGVAHDIREMGMDLPAEPTFYLSRRQVPDALMTVMNQWFLSAWIVRTDRELDIKAALRESIRSVDSQLPVASIRSMADVLSGSVASQRFLMFLMGGFAGLAVLLTAIGLYGILNYQVRQRRHEIGLRMALGANAWDVLSIVVGEGVLMSAVGIIVGLAGSAALTHLMSNYLYNLSPTDPGTFVLTSVLIAGISLMAAYLPARRAARVDPMVALRYE
jgi:putative ABC transport system permease protein